MKVYCFGNEFLEKDSLAKELADELHINGIKFIKCDSPNDLPLEQPHITILDVVENIKEPIIIEDISQLKDNKICTLHDFDLSFFLQLMKKTGELKKVTIIGIPMGGDMKKITEQVKALLT
jgi:Ni,Fe-hydrogenase maturation factor